MTHFHETSGHLEYRFSKNFSILFIFWLVHISFFGNLCLSLYYLLTLERNIMILYFSGGFVGILFLLSLVFQNFFQGYSRLLFNSYVIKYCVLCEKLIRYLIINHSRLAFLGMHCYLGLSFLHACMLFFWFLEPMPEILYCLFNLVRLVFSPLFFMVLMVRYSSVSLGIDPNRVKLLEIFYQDFGKWISTPSLFQETRHQRAFIFGSFGVIGAAVWTKWELQTQFKATLSKYGIEMGQIDPTLLNNLDVLKAYNQVSELFLELELPALSLFLNQIQSFWVQEKNLSERIGYSIFDLQMALLKAKIHKFNLF